MSGVLFYIIGIKTEDEVYQLGTTSSSKSAEKLATLLREAIRVTGGYGEVQITDVTE